MPSSCTAADIHAFINAFDNQNNTRWENRPWSDAWQLLSVLVEENKSTKRRVGAWFLEHAQELACHDKKVLSASFYTVLDASHKEVSAWHAWSLDKLRTLPPTDPEAMRTFALAYYAYRLPYLSWCNEEIDPATFWRCNPYVRPTILAVRALYEEHYTAYKEKLDVLKTIHDGLGGKVQVQDIDDIISDTLRTSTDIQEEWSFPFYVENHQVQV